MYFAYVLKSLHHNYYKGHCHDLDKRLNEHNAGKAVSLRPYVPLQLIYYEIFQTETEAIAREKYFKRAAERRYIKKKISRIEIS